LSLFIYFPSDERWYNHQSQILKDKTMRPDRAEVLHNAPLHDLLVILLRQYTRLLAERTFDLTENSIQMIADDIAKSNPPGEHALALRGVLVDLVEESIAVLANWKLTFPQSLKTEMGDMPGWETTAEFLDIANEKGNAELRIASASTLVAALGNLRFAPYLLATIAHDPDEIEAVVARRVLSQASGIAADSPDWQARLEIWITELSN
jgi:hypothetical protein